MRNRFSYADSGVDEPREQAVLKEMLKFFGRTQSIRSGIGRPLSGVDTFGSLVQIGPYSALAIATDGVGTKLVIAQLMKSYREVAVDLVANNVNDILCMGAEPTGILDYIGIDRADEDFLLSFSESFSDACIEANISVLGGEIAQIGEMLEPSHGSPRFDLVATAIGLCGIDAHGVPDFPRALKRTDVHPGQRLLALSSSGLHSNGFSLARRILIDHAGLRLDDEVPGFDGQLLGHVLLTPTRIYVKQVLPLLKKHLLSGLANISGGGLLTISRINPKLDFVIESLPSPHPIFELVQKHGDLPPETMFSTFNMGLGMVAAVESDHTDEVISLLDNLGEAAFDIGYVASSDCGGCVHLRADGLIGRDDVFVRA